MNTPSKYVQAVRELLQEKDPIIITPPIVREAGGRDSFASALSVENISLYPYKKNYVATRLQPYTAWRKLQERGD